MRKRTIKKQLWLDSNENRLLNKKANKAGLSEAEFLRSCIKGYKIKEQPTEEIKNFQKEITGIANNINQIAHNANLYDYVSNNDVTYIKNILTNFILNFEKTVYSRER